MKFFVDEDAQWDIEGYWDQLRALEPRLARTTFAILSKINFHDAQVLSMQVNNLHTFGRRNVKDPTELVVRLWHTNEYVYTLKYGGVTAMQFDFDWRKQTYIGLDDAEHFFQHDRSGIHDWLYDELTPYDDTYLSHEVQFASSDAVAALPACHVQQGAKEAPVRPGPQAQRPGRVNGNQVEGGA